MDEVVSAASYASTVGSMTFRKTDHHKNAIDYEVAGLMWLAAARPDGAGIVEVLDHGKGWLTELELSTVHPTREAAEDFGRRLAHTHAAGASHLGAAPDGFVPDDGYIGRAPLPLPSEPISSWGEFYAQYRIEPYMDSLDADARAIMSRLVDRLASGALDHDEPALVTCPAARTHTGTCGLATSCGPPTVSSSLTLPLRVVTPKKISRPCRYSVPHLPSESGPPTTRNRHWLTAGRTESGSTNSICSSCIAGSSAADTSTRPSRSPGNGCDPVSRSRTSPRGPIANGPGHHQSSMRSAHDHTCSTCRAKTPLPPNQLACPTPLTPEQFSRPDNRGPSL